MRAQQPSRGQGLWLSFWVTLEECLHPGSISSFETWRKGHELELADAVWVILGGMRGGARVPKPGCFHVGGQEAQPWQGHQELLRRPRLPGVRPGPWPLIRAILCPAGPELLPSAGAAMTRWTSFKAPRQHKAAHRRLSAPAPWKSPGSGPEPSSQHNPRGPPCSRLSASWPRQKQCPLSPPRASAPQTCGDGEGSPRSTLPGGRLGGSCRRRKQFESQLHCEMLCGPERGSLSL